jgi:alpha-tubulin suppressor-like RCC1 family protein
VAQAAHSIQISPAAIHLFSTNETIQLLAVVLDSLGAEVSAETIEWSSSDGNVASIEASGIVTGRSFGKTTLIASSGTINATATVSVQDGRWAQLAKPGGDNGICALRESGEAFCWGRNDVGQAGNGTSGDAIDDPSPVSGGHTFVMLARSSPNTCGLALSGMTYCWGFFTYDGIEETRGPANVLEPRAITHVVTRGEPVEPFANDFVSLSGGAQSLCALSRSGEAFCWGQNSYGQLGDSSANYGPVPSRVAGSHSWTSLSLGARHGCGVTNQGAAYCWGINESGQLGNGSTALTRVPTLVAGGLDWASVFAGANSTCAITTVGNSYCWGRNTQGEVGDGTTEDRLVPTLVTALGERRATRIWLSRFITCAVDSTGEGICWGDKPKNHPARSLSGSPWRSIVYQGGVPYALSEQGVLYVDGLVIL